VNDLLTSPRAATAVELQDVIRAERKGVPFLVYRDGGQCHRILFLDQGAERISIGRGPSADIALAWDEQVSRAHAELLRIGDEWTLHDDGLSLNGSFVNGTKIHGRRRLHDGDSLRVGASVLLFRDPGEAEARATIPSDNPGQGVALTPSQRGVLAALCRPYKEGTAFVTPATNEQIAADLVVSIDAVKKHMRSLFEKFGVEQLPQYEKRARLVERAFAAGQLSEHEL
jgi:hypothetical protein